MAINFPASPSVNDTFTEGSITYKCLQNEPTKWIGLGLTPADRLVEGSNKLEIDGSNNLVWTGNRVGIGTSVPEAKLEVVDTSSLGIISRSASTQATDTNKALKVRNNSTTDTFSVSYKGQGYFAGDVGIGVNNPAYPLDVVGDGGISSSASTNSTAGQLSIVGRNSSGSVSAISRIKSEPSGSTNTSQMVFQTRNSSNSMVERMRLDQSNVHISYNANNHTVISHGDPTDSTSFESQNRIGATTVLVEDESISAAIYMPRQGCLIAITAFSSVSESDYPQPNTSGMAYIDCGPSRNIQIFDLGTAVGTGLVAKNAYTSVVADCDNGKTTIMAGDTQGTFRIVNRESNTNYRYQITFL